MSAPVFYKPLPGLRISIVGKLLACSIIAALTLSIACIDWPELWDPAQSGKLIFFSYVSVILGVLMVIRVVAPGPMALRLNAIDVLLFFLLFFMVVNRYLIAGEYNYSEKFYALPGLVLVYIVLRSASGNFFPVLFFSMMAGGAIQAIYGLLQLYGYFPAHSAFRISGNFFNPGPYAGYLISVLPAILGLYLFRSALSFSPVYRLILLPLSLAVLLVFPVMLLALSATLSRAAWLAAIASTIFLLSVKYDLPARLRGLLNTKRKKRLCFVMAISLISAGLVFLYHFKRDSANGRLQIWKVTCRMIADHPLTGVGPDRFKAFYMNYQEAYFRRSGTINEGLHADNIYYAFNDPLQFVAENGLVGLCLLAAIIVVIVKMGKDRSPFYTICRAGLLSVTIFSVFSYPAIILPVSLNFIIYLSVLSSGSADLRTYTIPYRRGSLSMGLLRIGILATAILVAILVSGKIEDLYKGYMDWQTATSLYQMDFGKEALGFYERAYPVFQKEGDFLMQYGKALSVEKADREALEKLHAATHHLNTTIIQTAMGDSYRSLKYYDSAETAYLSASFMIPGRLYPKYLLAKLYDETGQKKKAVSTAMEILRHIPGTSSEAADDMKQEMQEMLNQYRVPIKK